MNFKRGIALLLAAVMVLGALPVNARAAKENFTLSTDKTTYEYGENILVTASGNNCWVGIYGINENYPGVSSYFWYYTKDYNNKAVAIQSTTSNNRTKVLDPGQYKVILFQTANGSDYNEKKSVTVTINEPSGDFTLTTNKDAYTFGEDILVTATGNNCWVGIYKANDSYGANGDDSFCYFYTKDYNGQSVAIQKTTANSRFTDLGGVLPAGNYVLRLFQTVGSNAYNLRLSKNISIAAGDLKPLTGILYQLDNETDGFANGTVTVTKAADNSATDCLLYWADANGNPLEGYTAMAKFKLTGVTTTHEMYHHTIIPQGAKKMIAYAVQNDVKSEGYVSVDLPAGCAFQLPDTWLAEFQIVSDTHVVTDDNHIQTRHFGMLLEDVRKHSPSSLGIFINGDVTDNGYENEYQKVATIYNAEAQKGLTAQLHIAIGNHDWNNGNPEKRFQTYAKKLNSGLTQAPSTVYYSETVGGYGFIYLGSEASGLNATLSDTQMKWFDAEMAKLTAANPDKPVFVFLHQGILNTVAGTLDGQGWHGVTGDSLTRLRAVLQKYPQIILFSGHSHWELNSVDCVFPGSKITSAVVNTASTGYLWSDYDVAGGEHADGSHGYYVRVYEDYVLFLGRSLEDNLFIPSALILVQRNRITCPDEVTVSVGQQKSLEAKALDGMDFLYSSADETIAKIGEGGVITGKGHGTTEITVIKKPTDTTVVDRKTVTVNVHNYVNGTCSVCGDKDHTCADSDRNHACDSCGGSMGTHAGKTDSHICDYCGKVATECIDPDRDHSCNICGGSVGTHQDSANSHICTYCGLPASQCSDSETDKDHKCDICGKDNLNPCVDESPRDHLCDICETLLSVCGDADGDNKCDFCGAVMCQHKDEKNRDHICDLCGKPISSCEDKTGDRDHACDICGREGITACADENPKDHNCDECGKTLTNCEDKNTDHSCDICGGSVGTHQGSANSHICTYCGLPASQCSDSETDKDHKCDICGKDSLNPCVDEDPRDHLCDICGKTLTTCENKNADYECDICGKQLEKPDIPTEPEETEPTEPEETEPTEPKETDPAEPEETDPTEPEETEVLRLAGENRFETAFLAADRMKEELDVAWFDAVIVASGANFADALSGSYLAAVKNAPILLSHKAPQNQAVKDYIRDNLAPNGIVYILGGTAAVPETMEEDLKADYRVIRLAGEDRFGTNLAILKEAGVNPGTEILVCTGANFADSLSASAVGLPILLVHKKLSPEQSAFLADCPTARATIIGGMNAVSAKMEESISDLGYSVGRIGGGNRFQTSVKIAETFFEETDAVVLAYAKNFPDGLCGGALAYAMDAPLILTMTDYSSEALRYLNGRNADDLLVLGGEGLISEKTVEGLKSMLR